MKDKIYYDHKLRGLVITISDEELAKLAERECEERCQPELLNNRINHVSYYLPDKESDTKQRKKFTLMYALIAIFWIMCFSLMILGVIKLTEFLAKWMP
jgi:hypothetical protein